VAVLAPVGEGVPRGAPPAGGSARQQLRQQRQRPKGFGADPWQGQKGFEVPHLRLVGVQQNPFQSRRI